MPAVPITDQRWSGLPLLECHMDPAVYRLDIEAPVLITRCDVGTSVEVHDETGEHPVFRQAPLRFDLFSAGSSMDAVSDRPATKSLVVALPPEWLATDDAIRLSARYQFTDIELQRLVGARRDVKRCAEHRREMRVVGEAGLETFAALYAELPSGDARSARIRGPRSPRT